MRITRAGADLICREGRPSENKSTPPQYLSHHIMKENVCCALYNVGDICTIKKTALFGSLFPRVRCTHLP